MNQFLKDIDNIPPNIKCIQGDKGTFRNWPIGDCFFGVPESKLYGRETLIDLPESTTRFHFYLGSESKALVQSFVGSNFIATVESLYIGNSSYNNGKGREYSDIINELEKSPGFPNLRLFSIGVWQLFSNSHCWFGNLGNITNLLDKMPNLEVLSINGNFILDKPFHLSKLKSLFVEIDDYVTCINGGYPTVLTISNLLSSFLPKLTDLYVNLECTEDSPSYVIPDALLAGDLFPELEEFELVGQFIPGSKEKLSNSQFALKPGCKFFIEDIV